MEATALKSRAWKEITMSTTKRLTMLTMAVVVAACCNFAAMVQQSSGDEAMSFQKASKTFTRYKQWTFGGLHKGSLYPTSKGIRYYSLTSRVNNKFLLIKKIPVAGIVNDPRPYSAYALAWSGNSPPNQRSWGFSTKDKTSTSPIRYGEPIAIQSLQAATNSLSGGLKYIQYSRRPVGVDVRLTKKKTYEWAFLGGLPGTSIVTNDVVVLYNLRLQQPLIHAKQKGKIADINFSEHAGIEAVHTRVKKNRAAVKFLLMPGVVVGK